MPKNSDSDEDIYTRCMGKVTRDNYAMWSIDAQSFLESQGLWIYVSGVAVIPPYPDPAPANTFQDREDKWQARMDRYNKYHIKTINLLRRATSKDLDPWFRGIKTAREIWIMLEKEYNHLVGEIQMDKARILWEETKWKGTTNKSLAEYTGNVEAAERYYLSFGPEAVITERERISKLKRDVKKDNVLTRWISQEQVNHMEKVKAGAAAVPPVVVPPLTARDLTSRMKSFMELNASGEEERKPNTANQSGNKRKFGRDRDNKERVFANKNRNWKGKSNQKGAKGKAYATTEKPKGLKDAKVDKSPYTLKNKSEGNKKKGKKPVHYPDIQCQHCHRPGHLARDCWNNPENPNNKLRGKVNSTSKKSKKSKNDSDQEDSRVEYLSDDSNEKDSKNRRVSYANMARVIPRESRFTYSDIVKGAKEIYPEFVSEPEVSFIEEVSSEPQMKKRHIAFMAKRVGKLNSSEPEEVSRISNSEVDMDDFLEIRNDQQAQVETGMGTDIYERLIMETDPEYNAHSSSTYHNLASELTSVTEERTRTAEEEISRMKFTNSIYDIIKCPREDSEPFESREMNINHNFQTILLSKTEPAKHDLVTPLDYLDEASITDSVVETTNKYLEEQSGGLDKDIEQEYEHYLMLSNIMNERYRAIGEMSNMVDTTEMDIKHCEKMKNVFGNIIPMEEMKSNFRYWYNIKVMINIPYIMYHKYVHSIPYERDLTQSEHEIQIIKEILELSTYEDFLHRLDTPAINKDFNDIISKILDISPGFHKFSAIYDQFGADYIPATPAPQIHVNIKIKYAPKILEIYVKLHNQIMYLKRHSTWLTENQLEFWLIIQKRITYITRNPNGTSAALLQGYMFVLAAMLRAMMFRRHRFKKLAKNYRKRAKDLIKERYLFNVIHAQAILDEGISIFMQFSFLDHNQIKMDIEILRVINFAKFIDQDLKYRRYIYIAEL